METLLLNIRDFALDYVSQFSFFATGDYYGGLFSQYFSVAGFILGLVFVGAVFMASTDLADDDGIIGYIKVVASVALINCLGTVSNMMYDLIGSAAEGAKLTGVDAVMDVPDNLISGFVLMLIIYSCFDDNLQAFMFGLASFAVIPLLQYPHIGEMEGLNIALMILRVLLAGLVCLIASNMRHFRSCWIWYFAFHVLMRALYYVGPLIWVNIFDDEVFLHDYSFSGILEYASAFIVDFVIFALILVFTLVFEKGVLAIDPTKAPRPKPQPAQATAAPTGAPAGAPTGTQQAASSAAPTGAQSASRPTSSSSGSSGGGTSSGGSKYNTKKF